MKIIPKIFWFIVVVLILYAGFFVYEKQKVQNSTVTETSKSPKTNNTPSPAAGLQTYTDKNYKFQINYPEDFSKDATGQPPIEDGNIQYNFGLSVIPPAVVFNLSPDNYKNTGFKYAYFSVTEYKGSGDYKSCRNIIASAEDKKVTNIDGRNFYRMDWSDNAMGGQRGVGYVYFGGYYDDKCIMMTGFLNYRDERGFVDKSPLYLEDSVIKDILLKFDSIAETFKSL